MSGDPSNNDHASFPDRLHGAIGSQAPDDHVLTGWVLCATFLDEDGDQIVRLVTMPGQTMTTDLGLSTYAHTRISHNVVCHGVSTTDDG